MIVNQLVKLNAFCIDSTWHYMTFGVPIFPTIGILVLVAVLNVYGVEARNLASKPSRLSFMLLRDY